MQRERARTLTPELLEPAFARLKPVGFFMPEAFMHISEIKTYVESHLVYAEDELKAKFAAVVAFVEGREDDAAQVDKEIAALVARGYTVIPPVPLPVIEVQP